jgi:hypothetical protein
LSAIRTDEDPRYSRGNSNKDNTSIHFDYSQPDIGAEQRTGFTNAVSEDLLLRGLGVEGSLEERRARLKTSLEMEWLHQEIGDAIAHGNKAKVNALFTLLDTVPCILHMENRCGLKIFTMLLIEGLSNALKAVTFEDVNSETKRMKAFFERVEDICNTEVWGTPDSPTQWICPRVEATREVGILCLDNMKTRALLNHFESMIELCTVPGERREMWLQCVQHYKEAMELVRSKVDLTHEEISEFQCAVDLFFQAWLRMHGVEGVTNYIHMLGAGHISEYLFYWGNLYQHSQQGWEAFNSLFKTFYFRRTARGGAGNHGTGPKSRVLPVARWLSHRLMWMCGISFAAMEQGTSPADGDGASETEDVNEDADHFMY